MRFRRITYDEVKKGLLKIIDLTQKINPAAAIVFTVSPIPLDRTFTSDDIMVANCISKSTLRAAVGEVTSISRNIHYFPSYEYAMSVGINFCEERDRRHPKKEHTDYIVNSFIESLRSIV